MSKAVKDKEIKATVPDVPAKKAPEFYSEEADVKELNDYLGLLQASDKAGILDYKSALDTLMKKITTIIKLKR